MGNKSCPKFSQYVPTLKHMDPRLTQLVVHNAHETEANRNNAIVTFSQPTEEVASIMRNFVATSTTTGYSNEVVKLMLWLFDNDPQNHFHDWIVQQAINADEMDKENPSKHGRKHLRSVFKSSLKNVRKKHCPVILETVDFNVFTRYVTSRKSKDRKFLSKSHYGTIQSSLKYLHKLAGFNPSEDFRRDMSQFNRGIKRKVAEEKQNSGSSFEEGKKAMNIEVYKLMAKKLFESGNEDAAFAHLYLVLEWNLMARSDNCEKLRLGHIEWRHDCLVFFFGKSKGDQSGELSDTPWHVYSNPFEPHICPVLALAKYLFSNPDIIKSKSTLFPGKDQYNR